MSGIIGGAGSKSGVIGENGIINITSLITASNSWIIQYNNAWYFNTFVFFNCRLYKNPGSNQVIASIDDARYYPHAEYGFNSIAYQGEYIDRGKVATNGEISIENFDTATDSTFRVDINMFWKVSTKVG